MSTLFPGYIVILWENGYHLIWCYNYSSVMANTVSKIEKVPRGIRGEKSSKDMASSNICWKSRLKWSTNQNFAK